MLCAYSVHCTLKVAHANVGLRAVSGAAHELPIDGCAQKCTQYTYKTSDCSRWIYK